ncbi:MAG: D-2-hydroxyacid dehydrogenase (NADP+) [Candidatus Azotimanducaceae bacterium]|jgi:D-2-hydroxyacid dehydrogenase (NADP+)
MMNTLHIYLKTKDAAFSFEPNDFTLFKEAHPDIRLKFIESESELVQELPSIEWLDTWFFDASWYSKAPKLQAIFTPAAGQEYIAADPQGRVPTHFGTFHGTMMAESALALILHFSLNLPRYQTQQKDEIWQRIPSKLLSSQTALIIGYGNIGRQTGKLLTSLRMTVWGHQRQPASNYDGNVQLIPQSDLDKMLPQADHIISFLPGGTATHHFISSARLNLISPHAFLYNFGRGTTIDESALITALQTNRIAGAGLDVTESEPLLSGSPLWQLPNVVLLPHASSYFEEYRSLHVTELTKMATKTTKHDR